MLGTGIFHSEIKKKVNKKTPAVWQEFFEYYFLKISNSTYLVQNCEFLL